MCGEDLELQLVVLDCVLKATTKNGRQLFRKKSAPRQNPGYAYALNDLERRNSPYFVFFQPNSIALLANYVTVVEENRPIG